MVSNQNIQADDYQITNDCATYNADCFGGGTYSAGADWLYWKTEETGLNYGISTDVVDDASRFTSSLERPNFKYESGYRVFGNYASQDQLWNVCLSYTHVPSNASSSYSSNTFLSFANFNFNNFPLFSSFIGVSLNSLNSHWHSSVNYVDFDVSRSFSLCDKLELMPHVGLRVLWMKQNLHISGSSIPEIGPGLLTFDSHLRSKFAGVGLEGGIKGSWEFYNGFSLVGNVGGSVLYTHFRNKGELTAGTDGAEEFTADYKESNHRGIPTFDSFIGIQYASCFYGYMTNIHLGWEQHIIYQTNDYSFSSNGSTTLQGLTLGAAVAF